MMDVLAVSTGGSPHVSSTDFSRGTHQLEMNTGAFSHMPSTLERTNVETDAKSAQPTEPADNQQPQNEKQKKVSDAAGDLDTTGDSDRLIIADEEFEDSEPESVPHPELVPKTYSDLSQKLPSEGIHRQYESNPLSVSALVGLEYIPRKLESQLEMLHSHRGQQQTETDKTALSQAQTAPSETLKVEEESCSALKPQTAELKSVFEESVPPILNTKDIQGTNGEDHIVTKVSSSEYPDFDTHSNASTDSGREQVVSQAPADTAEKKRRRRKPLKVSKHEPVAEDSEKEKLDNNYNSIDVVPEAKPVSRLMNSFVAKAMKLWYDEEVPKLLNSPSKDQNKYAPDSKHELKKVKESEAKVAIENQKGVSEGIKNVGNTPCKTELVEKDYRSGVAPDDQYYSTPSPATPECRLKGSVQGYWTPGRTPHSGDHAIRSDSAPEGTPLVAKAMQSLSSPSPAVSPSLASDQESPTTQPKRYFCSLCNKSFTFRTNLTRHQRAFHGRPFRRRTHDALSKEESDGPRAHSVSSDDADHLLERRDFTEEKQLLPKPEPPVDPHYGRFSPSVVSDAKAGRFSPSMPSPSASSSEPPSVPTSTFSPCITPMTTQNYVVMSPKEQVSCSLCLSSFESQSELSHHEPTCRGIDRSKLPSDSFGAIDLTKPKVPKQEPTENRDSETRTTYKPKFHYNMADMMKTPATPTMEPQMAAPFLPHPAALQGIPFIPPHLAASGLLPHQLTAGLPLPFSPSGPGKRPYRCTLCTKKYSSFPSLAKHVGFVHKINLMGMNQQQQQQQQDQDSMNAMVSMANAEMKMLMEQEQGCSMNLTADGMGHFPCKICGQTFTFAANLRMHYHSVHLGLKEVPGRETQSPDLARSSSKSTEWVCDICAQNFASKRNLNRHLSHVHKVDRKQDSQLHAQGGRSTPVDTKPYLCNVPVYPKPGVGQAVNTSTPKDDITTNSVNRLQDVVNRVISADTSLKQEPKPLPVPTVPPPTREHPVKLPPKKAIMEEYQKEAEMKLRLEREQQQQRLRNQERASPALSDDSGVLNLSQSKSNKSSDNLQQPREEKPPPVMDLSRSQGLPKDMPPVDLSSDSKNKLPPVAGERGEYYPNPFSAILNLSQTYLRKLLNETPVPNQPPQHPDLYTAATIKDKENSIENSRGIGYNRSGYQGGRDYCPDTNSRLRDMLTNKGLSVGSGSGYQSDDSRCSSRNNSLPPSGRCTPVDGLGLHERRPLGMATENQSENSGFSEISPLRMNTANMMALKQKLMDQNSIITPDWKPKNIKKRKNSDFSVDDMVSKEKMPVDGLEPLAKKPRDNLNIDQSKLPNVDSIKTGEFPAIAIGKRHICGLCGASFTFQTNLTRHQRKLHGKPFVRKSSINQIKSENPPNEDAVPLSMVPQPSSMPLTVIKQE